MALDPKNYVNVGKKGTFAPSGHLASTPAQLDALIAHLEQAATPRVVLHFHGGLVGEAAGIQVAEKLHAPYVAAGAHPVFFVWETGPFETIKNNLGSIHGTTLFQSLLKYALKYAAGKLGIGPEGARGASDAPMSMAEVELELAGDRFESFDAVARDGAASIDVSTLDETEEALVAELEIELAGDPLLEAAILDVQGSASAPDKAFANELATPQGAKGAMDVAIALARYLGKVVVAVIKRHLTKTQHDFYPTVIEELLRAAYLANLGEWLWSGMKEQARAMWETNAGLSGLDQHAGRYFLERLSDLQRRKPFTLDLVGHSAGSIAIGELLDVAAGYAPLSVRRIALLAPAIRSDRFLRQYVVPASARFEDLRIFTMADEVEKRDALVPVVYPRSLLYFISGVLEDRPGVPLLGLERFWDDAPRRDDVIDEVGRWVAAKPERRALSISPAAAPPGFQTTSTSHGDFDDDPPTRASLTHFIR